MAGATFGDAGVSLFVAGAAFGEIWVGSRSAKCCNFPYKMRLQSATSMLHANCVEIVVYFFVAGATFGDVGV